MKLFKATVAGISAGFIMSVVSFAHAGADLPSAPKNVETPELILIAN